MRFWISLGPTSVLALFLGLGVQMEGGAGETSHSMGAPSPPSAVGTLVLKGVDEAGMVLARCTVSLVPAPKRPAAAPPLSRHEPCKITTPLPAGSYTVHLAAKGYLSRALAATVPPERELDLGKLRLARAAELSGAFVDKEGGAIPGAAVTLRYPQGHRAPRGGRAGGDGAFFLEALQPGPARLEVRHPDYLVPVPRLLVLKPGLNTLEDQRLEAGGTIEARVVGSSGGGEYTVLLSFFGRSAPTTPDEADGTTFRFSHVPPGELSVALLRDGAQLEQRRTRAVEGDLTVVEFARRILPVTGIITTGGAPGDQLRVTFTRLGRAVSATATDEDWQPSCTTDDGGGYKVVVAEPGDYDVRVEALGSGRRYPTRRTTIPDVEAHSLDIDLPGTSLVGTVTDAESGKPVPSALVFASARRPGSVSAEVRTQPDGTFEMALRSGDYRLDVEADGYSPASMDVSATPEAPPVTISISKGTTVHGRLADPAGRGLSNQPVTASAGDFSRFREATVLSSSGGVFEIAGLAQTAHVLFAGSEQAGFAVVSVVPGGAETLVTVRPGGWARVRVVSETGHAVPGALVRIGAVDGLEIPAGPDLRLTGPDGEAVVACPPGAVTFRVTRAGVPTASTTVRIEPGAITTTLVAVRTPGIVKH